MNPHDPLTWTPIGRMRVFSTRVFDVVEIETDRRGGRRAFFVP
jgi:hypothetical protein